MASGSDPGGSEILHIKTPTVDNALRSILGQLNDSPVATKLDQPAAIIGPEQSGTSGRSSGHADYMLADRPACWSISDIYGKRVDSSVQMDQGAGVFRILLRAMGASEDTARDHQ